MHTHTCVYMCMEGERDIDSDGKMRWMHRKIENKTFLKLSFDGERASERARTHSSSACSTIFENFQLHNSIEEHTHTNTSTSNMPHIFTKRAYLVELETWIFMHTYLEYSIAIVIITEFNVQCSVSMEVLLLSNFSKSLFCYFYREVLRCLLFDRSMQYSNL